MDGVSPVRPLLFARHMDMKCVQLRSFQLSATYSRFILMS